ncbi:hypothetical protein RD792_004919 [Penstemon davidsonii]|uniref:Fe2OG dioxygenase domain-containing protein n=1 Tax=Penstemon davidsonii TaxID=160366 RepID=A0ABR0DIQ2_9LAMI|nr:hypothetical protein RD792_004919 [Penstemon davidsonii]
MGASSMRLFFALLAFVTFGMIIGALIQLAYIGKLEDSYGSVTPFTRIERFKGSGLRHTQGISYWDDKEAMTLRLGYGEARRALIASPRLAMTIPKKFALPQGGAFWVCTLFQGMKSEVRTSSGMFLSAKEREYPMIQAIEKRISVYSQIPVENGELIQKHRYEKNQLYRPHHDYFSDTFNLKRGGQRVATMLMYLSDNVEGGETYFPKAGSGECSCGGKMMPGLCVKPLKGDAVLFWSMGLDGQSDPNSLHGGCAVLSGEKWSATKWMRQKVTY